MTRTEKIELLEAYSLFLEKHGYIDVDWRTEEPFAIDEFLKVRNAGKKTWDEFREVLKSDLTAS
jgi:hypothetical protein